MEQKLIKIQKARLVAGMLTLIAGVSIFVFGSNPLTIPFVFGSMGLWATLTIRAGWMTVDMMKEDMDRD